MNISDKDLAIVKDILKAYAPGVKAWAYGSRVDGTNKKYSDLDLVLLPEEEFDFRKLCMLKLAFEESDLPITVDLHLWNKIPESFKETIIKKHEEL